MAAQNHPMDIPDLPELHQLQSAMAWDKDQGKLGKVSTVFLDPQGRPGWVSVAIGLFETKERVVPLAGARLGEGQYVEDLILAFDADTIKHAPHVAPREALTDDEIDQLRKHYGV